MQRKKQTVFFVAAISLFFLSLSCSLPSFLLGDSKQFEDGLVQDYHPADSSVSQYTLSVTQQTYVDEYGYPDRFVIFFFDEVLEDGQLFSMRHESWYYDARGYEIVFRNGDKFTERTDAPIQIEGLGHTVYTPQVFTAEMNLDALLAAQGETGFFVQNIDDDLITGELVFIQGLAVGFEDGHLTYVETLPLGDTQPLAETPPVLDTIPLTATPPLVETATMLPTIPLTATPPLVETATLEENSSGLTPQELAHQGTHTYEVSCTRDDGSAGSWSDGLTLDFVEGGVNWKNEDDDTIDFFQEIDINTYGMFGGELSITIIFSDSSILEQYSEGLSCTYLKSVLTP